MSFREVQCDLGSAEAPVEIVIELLFSILPMLFDFGISFKEVGAFNRVNEVRPFGKFNILVVVGVGLGEESVERFNLRFQGGLE